MRRLDANDPVKRLDAVKSLGESNDPKAIDYLIQAVNDADPRVEAKAVDYLGKLHAADSTPFLIQKLFTVGTRDRLRQRIVMTLGKIGDPRASRPLLQFVSQDINPDIRGAGIYALGELADESLRQDLARFKRGTDRPAAQAAGERSADQGLHPSAATVDEKVTVPDRARSGPLDRAPVVVPIARTRRPCSRSG